MGKSSPSPGRLGSARAACSWRSPPKRTRAGFESFSVVHTRPNRCWPSARGSMHFEADTWCRRSKCSEASRPSGARNWRVFSRTWRPRAPRPAAASPPDHLRLVEAATELVRSLGAKEPVVVMLEDVHWADEMSLRLMAFLARRIRSSRILVVLTIRDEEIASAPVLRQVVDELARESHFIHLALPPLSRASTTALVRPLIRVSTADVDAQLDAEIWRASAGNPFLVVETIRAIQEGTAPRTPAALPLPERVRRVVAGRLERLSDRGQHLASVAAIVGREFDFALLQRAAGLDERHAAEGVEELVRRGMLQGFGEQLDFTHEWIREVVYNELLHPQRRRLHVLVAKTLEDLHAGDPERHYAALAGHYRAGEVWEKA